MGCGGCDGPVADTPATGQLQAIEADRLVGADLAACTHPVWVGVLTAQQMAGDTFDPAGLDGSDMRA